MDRLRLPGWIIIGATGRNSGKTEFACTLIRAFSRLHPVIGVKVTAIGEGQATCPRGGEGCGACSTLDGEFILSEEHGEPPGKDTTRMLESGAHRVFWLRCGQARLRGAVEALVSRLDPGQLVVAESNSLAQVVKPDLFLMVRDGKSSSIKPTAAAVISMANRVVVSDGKAFDLSLQQLIVVDGVCRLVEASAVILAGGESRRMGQDKSMLPVKGKPLIRHIYDQLVAHFDEILISTNTPEKYAFLSARTVSDWVPGQGPLMGIASAVTGARHERVFVTACDIPEVDIGSMQRMLVQAADCDCVIGRSPAGHEPLFAVYRKSALPAMREVLEAGGRKISAIFPKVRMRFFEFGDTPWYWNLNTADDFTDFAKDRDRGEEMDPTTGAPTFVQMQRTVSACDPRTDGFTSRLQMDAPAGRK